MSYYYNAIFNSGKIEKINIKFKRGTIIADIIKEYFKRISKPNLLVKNIDNIYFISNGRILNKNLNDTLESIYKFLHFVEI